MVMFHQVRALSVFKSPVCWGKLNPEKSAHTHTKNESVGWFETTTTVTESPTLERKHRHIPELNSDNRRFDVDALTCDICI